MCNHKYLVERTDRLVLPDNVKPSKYDLHLTPNMKEFTFAGEQSIYVDVVSATSSIIMHGIEIDIKSVVIDDGSNVVKSITFHEPEEVVILEFTNELVVGPHVIKIVFTGILNDKLKGFYRSKYTIDGQDRYLATTQFEATDARRSFICFDEPLHKAVFNIKLTVASELVAISNMEEQSSKDNGDGTKTVTFEETPIMSTYLVAYTIGDMEYIESHTKGGIKVRVYKAKGVEESGEFALDVAVKAMDYLIDYFNIPYPLKKCDHVAIPDFAAGAMENWGMVTYRDCILLTSDKTTLATKQDAVVTISHELGHMWFGNLVTMEWWSQLWLNEGFATMIGYKVTDYLFPEWNCFLEFAQSYRNSALSLDALDNSHAIEVPVRSSAEVSEIFDEISYNKGSCVILMMESKFGESFRKGLHHYLNKHSYKNTVTEDLWESISLASGQDVISFINSYTKYPGYPVVSFTKVDNGTTTNEYQVTQKKFRLQGEEKQDDPLWNCFIRCLTDKGPFEFTLSKKSENIVFPEGFDLGKAGSFIKPNLGQTGYFRIRYDQTMINGLVPLITNGTLKDQDRLGLLGDVFNSCKSGETPISVYMDLISAYSNETVNDIWNYIVSSLSEITELCYDQSYHDDLKAFTIQLLKPLSNKLGFDPKDGESSSDTLLRIKVNTRLGSLGEKDIVAECKKRYAQYCADPNSLNSNVRTCVFVTTIKNGGATEQQEFINKYLSTVDIAEKTSLLSTICLSPSAELVQKALEFSVSKDVRSCEAYTLWRPSNQFKPIVWKYFTDNFLSLNEMFGQNVLFAYMISFAFTSKMNEQQFKQVEDFFTANPVPIADRSIKQDLEQISNSTKWFNSFNQELSNWLQNNFINKK